MKQQILHYPTLRTVLIVEDILKNADTIISKAELERRLPTQIMHQTLKLILEYLESSGKIIITEKGMSWIYKADISNKLKKLLEKSVRVA
jgi:chromosome segregation and condensation protein ScpB